MSKLSILIVDGDAQHQGMLPAMMKKYWFKDWTVVFAADREEALQQLSQQRFDVISLNLYLAPRELQTRQDRLSAALAGSDVSETMYHNGISAVAAIAAASRGVRLIAWSYYALPSHVNAARNAGACEVVNCRRNAERLHVALIRRASRHAGNVRHAA